MINRSHRLSTKQFMEVMEKGKMTHSPFFLLRSFIGKEGVNIATVAPKKVAPTAVLRNNTRRRIYEAIRPMLGSMVPGTRAIVFAKSEAIKASTKDISTDLKSLFSKAKIGV